MLVRVVSGSISQNDILEPLLGDLTQIRSILSQVQSNPIFNQSQGKLEQSIGDYMQTRLENSQNRAKAKMSRFEQ